MKKRICFSRTLYIGCSLLVMALLLVGCDNDTNADVSGIANAIHIDDTALVKRAIQMEAELYGKADTYATTNADETIQEVITYWVYNTCGFTQQNVSWQQITAVLPACSLVNPGTLQCNTDPCTVKTEGTLQCVEFVTGAFGSLGNALPISGNGNQFWTNYQNQAGWTEVSPNDISSGNKAPAPGDIIGFTNSDPNGHVGIVVAVQVPQGGNDGYIIVASANQPGNVSTADLAALGVARGNFYKLTWHSQNYLNQHSGSQMFEGYAGDVVQGFIRHISYAVSTTQSHYFAPYTEDTNLAAEAQTTGAIILSLAFITAQNNSCQPNLDQQMPPAIKTLQAAGKNVIISFGGEDGKELALACNSASALENAYQSVITTYGSNNLDFDIEGAAASDTASIDRRNQAIADLQSQNPNLQVSYTLAVNTSGLPDDDLNILHSAIARNVKINVVNLMTMDYYDETSAPGNQMGENAIKAATATETQLQQLYPNQTATQLWAMIGITPLIGVNDDTSETFTLDDASKVLAFAQQQQIGELSFWVVSRDHPCTGGGKPQNDTCSGTSQTDYDFSQIFSTFT